MRRLRGPEDVSVGSAHELSERRPGAPAWFDKVHAHRLSRQPDNGVEYLEYVLGFCLLAAQLRRYLSKTFGGMIAGFVQRGLCSQWSWKVSGHWERRDNSKIEFEAASLLVFSGTVWYQWNFRMDGSAELYEWSPRAPDKTCTPFTSWRAAEESILLTFHHLKEAALPSTIAEGREVVLEEYRSEVEGALRARSVTIPAPPADDTQDEAGLAPAFIIPV